MFVDEVTLNVITGSGGDGCTAFRHEKYIPMGGPYSGNGGHGSDIIFKVDEGIKRFSNKLRKMGIDEELERLGADDGDMVRILDFYFEYRK